MHAIIPPYMSKACRICLERMNDTSCVALKHVK